MGGTIGGATTSKPEYLTETQYYSPSEFEDVSRNGKSIERVLIGTLVLYCTHNILNDSRQSQLLLWLLFSLKHTKSHLCIALKGPLTGKGRRTRNKNNLERTGDRRIDIEENAQNSNASNTSKDDNATTQIENDYPEDGYNYYEDYEGLLKDYYEGDYNEDTFNEDESNIKQEL